MARLVIVTSGLYFDASDAATRARYEALSRDGHSGYILSVTYGNAETDIHIGNFTILLLRLPGYFAGYGQLRGITRSLMYTLFCLFHGIFRRNNYDIAIATDTFKSGLICLLLSSISRRPYLMEVSGNYLRSFAATMNNPGLTDRFKQAIVKFITPITYKHASAIKLLYPEQLDGLVPTQDANKTFVFHDITALSSARPSPHDERFILSVGHPWYLKGMDILIKAFMKIQTSMPGYRLVIVGYCPDPSEFRELIGENASVVLMNRGVPHSEVLELMSSCSIFVLASRTEAMGRVLLEAMASRKPIIASRIDGIPTIIRHNENGLLFDPENVDDLAEKISTLLSNIDLSSRLASQGMKDIDSRFSIANYQDKYNIMLKKAITKNSQKH